MISNQTNLISVVNSTVNLTKYSTDENLNSTRSKKLVSTKLILRFQLENEKSLILTRLVNLGSWSLR